MTEQPTQQITPQLARELWDQAPHTWNDLCQTLQSDPNRFENLDADFRDRLCKLAAEMQTEGNGFPDSPEKLFHTLANRLGIYTGA